MRYLLLFAMILGAAASASAEENIDLGLVTKIRDEGFRRSEVMDHAWHMTDVLGARVTASPALHLAQDWAIERLEAWGFENARLESYDYGRGWSWSRCSVDLLSPSASSLSALPQSWTPGTAGPVEGQAFYLEAEAPEDLEEFRGQLQGKVVFISEMREVEALVEGPFERLDADDIADNMEFDIPEPGPSKWKERRKKSYAFRQALDPFLVEEGAIAIVEPSSRDYGILRVLRGGEPVDAKPKSVPALTMMNEQYNRVLRLLEKDHEVRLRLDIDAQFHENDRMARNVVAEIPGRGKKNEVVIAGAHLDSYHAGVGGVDNAAGCAVMMEAVRIIRALDIKLDRTVRICLWSGEEQGLLGSFAYVDAHYAARPPWTDPDQLTLPRSLREKTGPIEYRDEWDQISAYFNLDNGSGRIRGIYCEENAAVKPIFEQWLAPFADLGAANVTLNQTWGTDHQAFDGVGIPGFQFIQDPLNYMPQLHHTHLDGYDHLQKEDLKQASVIVAAFLVQAANRDEMLPRKPKPQEEEEDQ